MAGLGASSVHGVTTGGDNVATASRSFGKGAGSSSNFRSKPQLGNVATNRNNQREVRRNQARSDGRIRADEHDMGRFFGHGGDELGNAVEAAQEAIQGRGPAAPRRRGFFADRFWIDFRAAVGESESFSRIADRLDCSLA